MTIFSQRLHRKASKPHCSHKCMYTSFRFEPFSLFAQSCKIIYLQLHDHDIDHDLFHNIPECITPISKCICKCCKEFYHKYYGNCGCSIQFENCIV